MSRALSDAPGPSGVVIAAPASGSGKTVVTLGLLRRLARQRVAVAGAKVGPDFIDPAFHAAACGRACVNLDPWAMRATTLAGLVATLGQGADLVICEGVMGLFDGAVTKAGDRDDDMAGDMAGSTAALAKALDWPVVLVVDARGQGASAGALLHGFTTYRADAPIAGVIFNRVAGARHEAILRRAAEAATPGLPVLGAIPRDPGLVLPARHLGLVQAREHDALDHFLDTAATHVGGAIDLDALAALARPARFPARGEDGTPPIPPPGRHIAIARDAAFTFLYEAVVAGWRAGGARILGFSPLADEGPPMAADAVYLPGGYPELHAARLAGNTGFREGMRGAARRGVRIYGECGGYMVLGETLEDATGAIYPMLGLLPLQTSLARARMRLGYRTATLGHDGWLGRPGAAYRAHEFHYARAAKSEGQGELEGDTAPLFTIADAAGAPLPPAGLVRGGVSGSFLHLLDAVEQTE